MLDRFSRITERCNLAGKGLEIGPSYSPICPKSKGFDIEIIDHIGQEELRKKYAANPGTRHLVDQIEEVDYIWKGEDYSELTGKKDYYDYIIASNLIEHTTDLIGFLNQCATLLKEDGILSLVVPDKRYCFDFFRENSSLAKVIDRHQNKDSKHSKGAIIEHISSAVALNHSIVWNKDILNEQKYSGIAFQHAKAHALEMAQKEEYVDVHEWVFTPGSFRILINDLRELGYIYLTEETFYPTDADTFEFYVSLRKVKKIDTEIPFSQEIRMKLYEFKLQEEINFFSDPWTGKIAQPDNGNEALMLEYEQLLRQYECVITSNCWKMTGPIRRVLDFVKSCFRS